MGLPHGDCPVCSAASVGISGGRFAPSCGASARRLAVLVSGRSTQNLCVRSYKICPPAVFLVIEQVEPSLCPIIKGHT